MSNWDEEANKIDPNGIENLAALTQQLLRTSKADVIKPEPDEHETAQ